MKRNIELLETTMQFIKDNPEKHNQTSYVDICGTASCFAGWALELAGELERVNKINAEQNRTGAWYTDRAYPGLAIWGAEAARILGLNRDEARMLFSECNSRDQIEELVKELVNGEDITQ